MTEQNLLCNVDAQGCLYITLNRPEVYNAFDENLIQELIKLLEQYAQVPEIRAVILKGSGKVFCAGADLHWMQRMADFTFEQNVGDANQLAKLLDVWNGFPRPTIAVVHGAAYGGAVGLVAAADIVVTQTKAIFCLSEVKLGLVPAVISPYVVNAIGQRQTRRFALTAEKISAELALQIGLTHYIAEDVEEVTQNIIEHLLNSSPQAQATTKELIGKVESRPIDSTIHHLTAEVIARARASEEGREGLRAFFEKRVPQWNRTKDATK
jgi:methylglutaconyl-CoA hydratase